MRVPESLNVKEECSFRVGLQNPGVDAVTDEEIPALSEVFTKR
jgi:hypothetical protein